MDSVWRPASRAGLRAVAIWHEYTPKEDTMIWTFVVILAFALVGIVVLDEWINH